MMRNRVAHYQKGNSDKVYVVSIRHLPGGSFQVIAKWNRRGKQSFQNQVYGDFASEASARVEMKRIFNSKLRKGYVNVESPVYDGSLTAVDVANALEEDVEELKVNGDKAVAVGFTAEERAEIKEAFNTSTSTREARKNAGKFRVTCRNNLGIEHLFDEGAEYLAERTGDDEMLKVIDKHGDTHEAFASRFEMGVTA